MNRRSFFRCVTGAAAGIFLPILPATIYVQAPKNKWHHIAVDSFGKVYVDGQLSKCGLVSNHKVLARLSREGHFCSTWIQDIRMKG